LPLHLESGIDVFTVEQINQFSPLPDEIARDDYLLFAVSRDSDCCVTQRTG
jgi:hypothetical protein